MRQLDAEPARGVEDGLAGADFDFAVVDGERLCSFALAFAGARGRAPGMC
jgi:hypothetical protein